SNISEPGKEFRWHRFLKRLHSETSSLFDKQQCFLFERHEVGATVTRHDNRAACIPHPRRAMPVPPLQITVDQTAGERVTGSKYIANFNGERCCFDHFACS